jgi:heme-degrading monooxygenase HmoA
MSFRKEHIETFKKMFDEKKEIIATFPGCRHLELWQDDKNPGAFFTYSIWNSEADLDHYRFSSFFKETWAFTKSLFAAKPEAWTLNPVNPQS